MQSSHSGTITDADADEEADDATGAGLARPAEDKPFADPLFPDEDAEAEDTEDEEEEAAAAAARFSSASKTAAGPPARITHQLRV